jgi:hypothetical protein
VPPSSGKKWSLTMKAARYSVYKTVRRHIPEDDSLHNLRCELLKHRIFFELLLFIEMFLRNMYLGALRVFDLFIPQRLAVCGTVTDVLPYVAP